MKPFEVTSENEQNAEFFYDMLKAFCEANDLPTDSLVLFSDRVDPRDERSTVYRVRYGAGWDHLDVTAPARQGSAASASLPSPQPRRA